MLMFYSQNKKFTHLHSGSWSGRGGGKNQTALEALTRKRKARSQLKSTTAILPSWFLQSLGALHGEGRRAWRWPLLDPPRKGAGVWGKGSRLVINESSYLGRPCPRGRQGKRCRRFSRGWEASDGQDPKPRNSRNNTSQSRDTGGLGGTT